MKNRLLAVSLFIVLLMSTVMIGSCNHKRERATKTGDTSFAHNVYESDILAVDDGYVLVRKTFQSYSPKAYIAKYDKQCKLIWETGFSGGDGRTDFDALVEVEDGYIVRATSYGGNPTNITIKYDKSGNLLWKKKLGISAMLANSLGFVAISGTKTSTSTEKNGAYITQYNFDGEVIWEKALHRLLPEIVDTEGDIFHASPVKLFFNPYNNDFLVFVNVVAQGRYLAWVGYPIPYVYSFNQNGDYNWDKRIDLPKMSWSEKCIAVSDGFITVGRAAGTSANAFQIVKHDFDFNVEWETQHETTQGYFYANQITQTGDDIFFSAGMVGMGGMNSSKLYGIHNSGNIFWDSDLRSKENAIVNCGSIVITENGIAVYSVVTQYNENRSAILDITGSLVFFDTIDFVRNSDEKFLYTYTWS